MANFSGVFPTFEVCGQTGGWRAERMRLCAPSPSRHEQSPNGRIPALPGVSGARQSGPPTGEPAEPSGLGDRRAARRRGAYCAWADVRRATLVTHIEFQCRGRSMFGFGYRTFLFLPCPGRYRWRHPPQAGRRIHPSPVEGHYLAPTTCLTPYCGVPGVLSGLERC